MKRVLNNLAWTKTEQGFTIMEGSKVLAVKNTEAEANQFMLQQFYAIVDTNNRKVIRPIVEIEI